MIMESKDCITISDDEEDNTSLADVSVQVLQHVRRDEKPCSSRLDASIIDLTNGDDSFRPTDNASPTTISSPTPPMLSQPTTQQSSPSPVLQESSQGSDVDEAITEPDSPPLIPPPTPSPPPRSSPQRSSSEKSNILNRRSSPRLAHGRSPPPTKKPSPINKSPKMDKLAREQLKRLKQKEKEEEKLVKDANRANAANKALQNCTAILDKSIFKLINDEEETIFRTLFDESMLTYRLSEFTKVENSITWSYKRVEVEDGQCVSKFRDADWIIVVMDGREYFKRIIAYRDTPDDRESIKSYICDIRRRSQSSVILIVYNLSNFLKSEKQKEAKNYRKTFKDRFEGNNNLSNDNNKNNQSNDKQQESCSNQVASIGTTDLQELRLMMEVELKHEHPDLKAHLEFYEKTQDIVHAVVRYTCSIAKYEVKRKVRSSTDLDWAINMDKEKACDPTKSSEDLTKLWITQLQQFSQITLPVAKAIAAEYPSPSALLDQYKSLSKSEAEDLLAELYVQKNLRRQIGPNLSRKIHCFMTCDDPDVHIGYN